jgi:hypothetical protein
VSLLPRPGRLPRQSLLPNTNLTTSFTGATGQLRQPYAALLAAGKVQARLRQPAALRVLTPTAGRLPQLFTVTAPPRGPKVPPELIVGRRRSLLASLVAYGADGQPVPIINPPYRGVEEAPGLAGVKVRESVTVAVGKHGSVNRSRFRDDRTVTLTGWAGGEDAARAWSEYDGLSRALCSAVESDRTLAWTVGARALQSSFRLVSLDPQITAKDPVIRWQAVLRCSDPRAYSQTENVALSQQGQSGAAGGGLTFPRTFPVTFNATTSVGGAGGGASCTNNGTVPTPPTIIIRGMVVNPLVQLGADGPMFSFPNLTVDAGDALYINTRDHTIMLNGTGNRLNTLDFRNSRLFELPVGQSLLRLSAVQYGPSAQIEVRWRDAYQ